jgi:hypothetical protein
MNHKKARSKTLLIVFACLVIIFGVGIGLEATGTIHLLNQKGTVISNSSVTHNKNDSRGPVAPPKGTLAPTSPTNTGSNTSSPVTTLLAPSGAFVSFHDPSISGSSTPNQLQSSCISTPGASCTIEFTNNTGVTESLPSQVIDGTGHTTWSWKVQDLGLTVGSWKITAIATLNGQSKSTNDTIGLNVQP